MEYKKEQLSTVFRHTNSIEAALITEIKGNDFTIERFNGQTLHFPVNCAGDYEPGQYIDIQYFRTGGSSHTMKLIGHTPPEFIPDRSK